MSKLFNNDDDIFDDSDEDMVVKFESKEAIKPPIHTIPIQTALKDDYDDGDGFFVMYNQNINITDTYAWLEKNTNYDEMLASRQSVSVNQESLQYLRGKIEFIKSKGNRCPDELSNMSMESWLKSCDADKKKIIMEFVWLLFK
jgi:hypothetical protein